MEAVSVDVLVHAPRAYHRRDGEFLPMARRFESMEQGLAEADLGNFVFYEVAMTGNCDNERQRSIASRDNLSKSCLRHSAED